MGKRDQATFNFNGSFTACETTDQYPGTLGVIVEDGKSGCFYQRVQLSSVAADSDTTVPAATLLARWKDSDTFVVCSDYAISEGGINAVAGIFVSAPTAGQYCWVKKRGLTTVACDGTAAVGATCFDDGTANGTVSCVAAGSALTGISVGVVTSVSSTYTSTAPQVRLSLMRA